MPVLHKFPNLLVVWLTGKPTQNL